MANRPSILEGGYCAAADDGCVTIGDVLERSGTDNPGDIVRHIRSTAETSTTETRAELLRAARGVAQTLVDRRPGGHDRVLIQCDDTQVFLHALWGTFLAGLIPVPVPVVAAAENDAGRGNLRQLASTLECRVAVVSARLSTAVARSVDGLATEVVIADDCESTDEPVRRRRRGTGDTALIQPTSGTTSAPKLVRLTHGNVLAVLRGTAELPILSYSRSLSWMPLEHIGSLVWHLRNVLGRCREEALAHPKLFLADPLRWLDWLTVYEAEMTRAANFGYALVVRELEAGRRRAWSLSSVRVCVNTTERVDPDVCVRFLDLLGSAGLGRRTIYPSYGMAELGSGVVYSTSACDPPTGVHYQDWPDRGRSGTRTADHATRIGFVHVGRPIRGLSVRIVGEDGVVVPEGTVGYVQASGDSMTPGYLEGRETAERFTQDGWFRTGDTGLVTDGELVITGRAKDVVAVRGVNIGAREIEAVVGRLVGVDLTSVAVCQPVSNREQEVFIFFSQRVGTVAASPLVAQIRTTVARVFGFVPDQVVAVRPSQIPRTATGKIRRGELEELAVSLQMRSRAEGPTGLLPDWFSRRTWKPLEMAGRDAGRTGRCVVFADSRGLADASALDLVARGWEVIRVYRGSTFLQRSHRVFEVAPRSEADYARLFQGLSVDGFDEVLHFWSSEVSMTKSSIGDFERVQDHGLYSVVRLMRALALKGLSEVRVTVVTAGTHVLGAQDAAHHLAARATVNGLVAAAAVESGARCRQIDLPEVPDDVAVAATWVADEVVDSQVREPVVAYRERRRLVPRLSRVHIQASTRTLPFPKGGVCLVTGGFGGIGIHLCRHLLEAHGAKLLVVGRKSQAGVERSDAYAWLAATGEVMYRQVVLSDVAALRRVVSEAEGRWRGPLASAFHLAGVRREVLVARETVEGIRAVFEGKVYGALAIRTLVRERPEVAVVFFSSVAAVVPLKGRRGLGAYAAANSYLDYLAEAMKREGRNAWSINWSEWADTGMSRGRTGGLGQTMGMARMEPAQGIVALDAVLGCDAGQVVVGIDCRVTNHGSFYGLREAVEISQKWGREGTGTGEPEQPVMSGEGTQAPVRGRNQGSRLEDLTVDEVIRIWAEVLNDAEIDAQTDFFEAGGDSIHAMQILGRLEQELHMEVSMTDLVDNPSPVRLWVNLRSRTNPADA